MSGFLGPLIAGTPLVIVPMVTLFHHTANGFKNYVDVAKALRWSDDGADAITGITLTVREHRNGRIVDQQTISYCINDAKLERKIRKDALSSFNYAILVLQLPFVCDTEVERIIRSVIRTRRLVSACAH